LFRWLQKNKKQKKKTTKTNTQSYLFWSNFLSCCWVAFLFNFSIKTKGAKVANHHTYTHLPFANKHKQKKKMWSKRKTNGGITLDVSLSTLQKSIRRGETALALEVARDLLYSGMTGYAIGRLKVVVSEDIGVASDDMPQRALSLLQNAQKLEKDGKPKGKGVKRKGSDAGEDSGVRRRDRTLPPPERAVRLVLECVHLMCSERKFRGADYAGKIFYRHRSRCREAMRMSPLPPQPACEDEWSRRAKRLLMGGDPKSLLVEPLGRLDRALEEGDEVEALYWCAEVDSMRVLCATRLPVRGRRKPAKNACRPGLIVWRLLMVRADAMIAEGLFVCLFVCLRVSPTTTLPFTAFFF
jgi:hypothetical protein